jgi:hypothetical protein
MLRLLASNPELHRSGIAFISALPHTRLAHEPRWGGYRTEPFSCPELTAMGLACTSVATGGFRWGSAQGVGTLVVMAAAALLLSGTTVFILWRRRRRHARGVVEEGKAPDDAPKPDNGSQDADTAPELRVEQVAVEPYEPDGYDPNTKSILMCNLTTGEQVIKARVRAPLRLRSVSHPPVFAASEPCQGAASPPCLVVGALCAVSARRCRRCG